MTETVETNNTRATAAINVGSDLVVTAMSAPASGAAGGTISVTDTTKNQGGGSAAATTTRFYWSTNTSVDASDQVLGNRSVPILAAGVSNTASTTLTVPANAATGTYYIIAQADGAAELTETVETNNTRASGLIQVGGDLVMTALSAPAAAAANTYITVTDTAKNQGTAPIAGTVTGFYLSLNNSINPTDTFLGTRNVGALAPSATESASTQLLIPPGTLPASYTLLAVADMNDTVAESLENNNGRGFGWVRVGPDMIVSALTAPASAAAGTSITAGDTTNNQGAEATPPSMTSYYLSTNSTLDAANRAPGRAGGGCPG